MNKKPKGWYKSIAIRPVVGVKGYESYEKACNHVADTYFSTDEQTLRCKLLTNVRESMYVTLYALHKVGEAKCPAYWVSKDLLTALMQSELSVETESLNWAMKTGMFMLPCDTVFSPEKRSIYAIYWHYNAADGFLCWAATDGDSFFCRKLQFTENIKKFTYTDVQDLDPQLVAEFNEYLQAIFLRLILIMECRPELVDTESPVVRVNQGFAKDKAKDLYEPLWIGKNYSVKRDVEDKGGTHASPRIHWRRGFLRNQPYGQGRQQKKIVWIEPVLVMGNT
ncbi:hypothetical protein [Chroococcidiopsis sp. TS-821]|uniref:hypothetical protein n=1 Tax=Chroococcidiopsis sp. TS-821 TaxID=1378066 RepID=UPI000CEF1C82|nr:hypothetical protein [Chroococcidiopsis sp. TS-821]PPS41951.1 hypothetical protein B1A85_15850 [Chroococcidiopsis sp. TS-821]